MHDSLQKIHPAKRIGSMRYAVRDILSVAAEAKDAGRELLYLNIGDPNQFDHVTPPVILEAITKAMADGFNGYAPSGGVPDALEAIREDCAARGISNVQDVYISNGCSEGIEVALSALCEPGENILTPSPGYPLYTALVCKLGLCENPYFLDEGNGWQPDLEDLESRINDKTRAIVLINPNNPTGSVCSRETLQALLDIARRHGLLVISDEIYGDLTLDGIDPLATASLDADLPILTFNGLSKTWLAPGLRVGWGVLSGREDLVCDYRAAIAQLLRARLSSNHPEQYAIRPALQDRSHLPSLLAKITARRDLTIERLRAIDGIDCVRPQGAFYAFPSLDVAPEEEEGLIADLIRATGVVVVHGGGFGQRPGTSHFRVVFLPTEAVLGRAFDAMQKFMTQLKKSED